MRFVRKRSKMIDALANARYDDGIGVIILTARRR